MRLRSDIGRTHIAVEHEHMEWRDHRTNLMWHSRASLTYMYHRFRTGALRTPGTGGVGLQYRATHRGGH